MHRSSRRGKQKSHRVVTRGAEVDQVTSISHVAFELAEGKVEVDPPSGMNDMCDTGTDLKCQRVSKQVDV